MKLSQGDTLTTISASVQLHTQGDIAVPSLWIDSHKASSDWWYYSISYRVIDVVVSAEKLKGKKREKFKGVQWILIRLQNLSVLAPIDWRQSFPHERGPIMKDENKIKRNNDSAKQTRGQR